MVKKMTVFIMFFIASPSFALSDDDDYYHEIQNLMNDVKAGIKDKSVLDRRTTTHCEPPLILLTKQNPMLEEIKNQKNRSITFIEDLLNAGCNPNVENFDTETALGNAVKYSSIEVVELLLKYGANPNLQPFRKNYGKADHIIIQYLNNIDNTSIDTTTNKKLIQLLLSYKLDVLSCKAHLLKAIWSKIDDCTNKAKRKIYFDIYQLIKEHN